MQQQFYPLAARILGVTPHDRGKGHIIVYPSGRMIRYSYSSSTSWTQSSVRWILVFHTHRGPLVNPPSAWVASHRYGPQIVLKVQLGQSQWLRCGSNRAIVPTSLRINVPHRFTTSGTCSGTCACWVCRPMRACESPSLGPPVSDFC